MNNQATAWGGAVQGIQGIRVQVQAQQMPGRSTSWLRGISITGCAGREVREAEERIAGAFNALGISAPEGQVLVNLSPAGAAKLGTSLDLPIALAICRAVGLLPRWDDTLAQRHTFIGELDLYGGLRPTPGALPIAFTIPPNTTIVVPEPNKKETSLLRADPTMTTTHVLVANTFGEVLSYAQGRKTLPEYRSTRLRVEPLVEPPVDFGQIKGQKQARRAIEIAAAGQHSALLNGPAGCGKTLIASAMAGILPNLTQGQKVELTRIYSAAGRLREGAAVTRRPFRVVHHTASPNSLIGGGSGRIVPGEISLAHMGVLLLDELPEFHRNTLEALRQPIESGQITITRVGLSVSMPCRFQLIASCNPCPCGYNGVAACPSCKGYGPVNELCPTCGVMRKHLCHCHPFVIRKYQAKLTGPLMDRIDLHCTMLPLRADEFMSGPAESTIEIQRRVQRAREAQLRRFQGTSIACNADMPPGNTAHDCQLTNAAKQQVEGLITNRALSARRADRLMRVARTIADIEGCQVAHPKHIQEAANYSS